MPDTHMKVEPDRFDSLLRLYQELHGKDNVVDINREASTFTILKKEKDYEQS